MKLHEIALSEEQLDEANLRHALASVGLAGALALSGATQHPLGAPVAVQKSIAPTWNKNTSQSHITTLTRTILDKYSITPGIAAKVAATAKKYEYSTFPKAEDILSIVGIESSFNPHSVSGLRHDPAKGLMQVRPGVWNLSPRALSTIDKQIKVGSMILRSYYQKLGSVEAAVHAYNVGITNFKRGTHLNPEYVEKYNDERKLYNNIM